MASELLRGLVDSFDQASADFAYVGDVYRAAVAEGDVPEGFEAAYTEHRDKVDAITARIAEVQADESRRATVESARSSLGVNETAVVKVKSEPRTYRAGGPESFYLDMARAAVPTCRQYDAANDRLRAHGAEVAGEMRDSNSKEGRAAAKQIAAANQSASDRKAIQTEVDRARNFTADEFRVSGLSTGSNSGGSFVTPAYFVSDYAPYRQFGRPFADACHKEPLPEYGVTLYLPSVSQAASVYGTTTENIGVAEQDPTAAYISTNLTTNSGQVVVSQQLLDRAGPNFAYDTMVFDQLTRAYNLTLDKYALTNAINTASVSAGSVTDTTAKNIAYATSLGIAGAKANIEGTAGTVLNPTHIFAQVTPWEWLLASIDANGRPLFNPDYAGPWAAQAAGEGTPTYEGQSTYRWNGLPVYKDNNIPNVGSNYQYIVADMEEVWLWEGDLVNRAIPQTYANQLSVLLQVYAYVGLINRYPTAVQSVNGTATATALYTF